MSFFGDAFKWLGGNSFGSNLAKTAILGYASRLLTDNVSDTTSTETIDEGARLQLNPSTETKIPVLYGSAYFAGSITDAQLSSDYKQMRYCLTLSELTGNAIDGTASSYTLDNVYFNNNRVVFDVDGFTASETIDSAGNQDPSVDGLIKVYLYKESTPLNGGPAPDTLFDNWSAVSHPMSGLLYAIVEVNYNRSKNVVGLPECVFHITNSTDMPGDVLNDYMTNNVYGGNINVSDITGLDDLNTHVASGFTYTDASGSSQVGQARINGLVNTGTNVLNNMQAIAKATGSWLSYDIHEGKWSVIINKAGSSVASFDDSNIIDTISVSGTSLTSLYNSAEVQYQNTDILDTTDFVKIDIPGADLFNNEPDNTLRMVLPFTNKQSTALKVGLIDLKQSRVDKIISFKADYSFMHIKAGELIDVSSSVYNYTNKVFRVVNVKEVETSNAIVLDFKCIEYDADVYIYNISEFAIETDDGLLSIGSIGKPNQPNVTNNGTGSSPHILIDALVPSGIVDEMEFWVTHDTSVANDIDRTYVKVGTQSNTDGSAFNENQAVQLKYTQLNLGDLYVKVRGMNNITTGPYSNASGLIAYVPVQEPDNLPDDVSIGGQLLNLGLMTLMNNLDVLFDGDPNTSLIDAILDDFFPSSTGGTPTEQMAEALVADQDFINDLVTATQGATVVAPQLIDDLTDVDTTTSAPAVNAVLFWDGTNWVPNTINPDTGEPTDPVVPPVVTCNLTQSGTYPSDGSNTAPITGSYFIVYDNTDIYTPLTLGLGNVDLYESDGTLVETLPESSLVIDNNTIELPFADRTLGTDYYILMDEGIVEYCDGCLSPAIVLPTPWNFNTSRYSADPYSVAGSLNTPTALSRTSYSPTGTICNTQNTITLDFNQYVVAGAGNIVLHKDNGNGTTSTVETFAIGACTVVGISVETPFIAELVPGTDYFITLDAGLVITDNTATGNCGLTGLANQSSPGETDVTAMMFTASSPLTVVSTSPTDDTIDVDIETELTLTFNRSMSVGTGNFYIHKADSTLVQTLSVTTSFDSNMTSGIINISGSTVTINPTRDLEQGIEYYILADAGTLTDACGYTWAGITDTTFFTFTTDTGPAILSTVPTAGSTANIADTGIQMEFDRPIQTGPGQAHVYTSSGVLVDSFDATDARVVIT